ncbi:hypothetical protein SOVF_166440, partial [Spinacia oleracea]
CSAVVQTPGCWLLLRLWGFSCYTELEIVIPDNGVIGLHSENLEIERVLVDGEPAEFDVFPHYQPVEIEKRWCSMSSVSSAADAAGVTYILAVEREIVSNLLILSRKSIDTGNQQQGQLTLENGGQSNSKVKQVLFISCALDEFFYVNFPLCTGFLMSYVT